MSYTHQHSYLLDKFILIIRGKVEHRRKFIYMDTICNLSSTFNEEWYVLSENMSCGQTASTIIHILIPIPVPNRHNELNSACDRDRPFTINDVPNHKFVFGENVRDIHIEFNDSLNPIPIAQVAPESARIYQCVAQKVASGIRDMNATQRANVRMFVYSEYQSAIAEENREISVLPIPAIPITAPSFAHE